MQALLIRLFRAFAPALYCCIIPLSSLACFPSEKVKTKQEESNEIEMQSLTKMEEGLPASPEAESPKKVDYTLAKEYAHFIWDYVKKTGYIKSLLRNFVFSFVTKTILTYIQTQLFVSNPSDPMTRNRELTLLALLMLCRGIDLGAKTVNKIYTSRNEQDISQAFKEDTFHRKAHVPYKIRKNTDLHDLTNTEEEVEAGVINVITSFFQSIISMLSDIIVVTTLFYQNNLLWMFSIISLFFYTTIRYITYPMIKKGQKEREKIHEKRRELYGRSLIAEFGFEEFPETFPRFKTIHDIYRQIFESRMEAKWINTVPTLIVNIAAEISMMAMLGYTFVSQSRNYFVAVMVVSQLLSVCTEAVSTTINMEETLEKYAEYTKAYKKVDGIISRNEDDDDNASGMRGYDPHTTLEVDITICDGKTLRTPPGTPLEFDQGDNILITGNSGQGKTTLAEFLSGRDYGSPTFGNRRLATYYLPQDYNKTWSQRPYTIDQVFPNHSLEEILRILDAFQFPRNKLPTPITKEATFSVMSGGEMKRLQYAILLTRNITPLHQVIILDEPHKELDIQTAAKMVNGIKSLYPDRTIMVIQHEKPLALSHWREWHIEEGVIYQR